MNMFTKRKAHLAAIALLVLGQSLFAGGGSGSAPRQWRLNQPGFFGPVLNAAARAAEGVVARHKEDVTTERVHTGKREMEEPEAAESEASGGDEGVFPLGDLSPEVIVHHVIPYLGDRELGRLALTSHWTAELVREELKKRYTSHIQRTEQRIHALAQLASSLNYLERLQAAREMGDLFASSEFLITREQVEAVLTLLIGDDNHSGLAGDVDAGIRSSVVQAIGTILPSGKLGEGAHIRLLTVLIGENEAPRHQGLAGDPDTSVLTRLAEVIGTILAPGIYSEEERSRLLDALIGNEGLVADASRWVRISVVETIRTILTFVKCREDEHSRLLNTLNRLTEDPDQYVRSKVQTVLESVE